MIEVGQLRKGITISLDGELLNVIAFEHIKMGRGSALARLRLRNVRSGAIFERTFQASEKFLRVFVEQRRAQFLYREDNLYIFMDSESFDQYVMSSDQLDDSITFLKDGLEVELRLHEGNAIGIEIPISVEFEVVEADPGFKGNTAASTTKPAILETGLKINVPLFVNVGDTVLVDTRKGEYIERVT